MSESYFMGALFLGASTQLLILKLDNHASDLHHVNEIGWLDFEQLQFFTFPD
ncbi:hypothetical protein [Sutcliffiella sp. NC1]|uniref:hypothetical protein n=1 Tax=Sutcliffiella sp. NC1 TaxID=3004096 RepID=UPI0022DD6112|nr:hypothetical protein [Sutcliffiella sp. NC1]WBL13965.1 hypothetical protein O1A01_18925 [Sutcliffiella sp. NC1]